MKTGMKTTKKTAMQTPTEPHRQIDRRQFLVMASAVGGSLVPAPAAELGVREPLRLGHDHPGDVTLRGRTSPTRLWGLQGGIV